MKTRALLLVLCLAGLATVIWPPEVMSPAQEELIANAPSEGSGAGELLDMSAGMPMSHVSLWRLKHK